MRRHLLRDLVLLHLGCAVVVGVAWWALAPRLTYTVIDGQAFPLDQTVLPRVFGGDAAFVLLAAAAGLVCAGVLLLRGHRGAAVPVGLAVGGMLGAAAAWGLAVLLGPGRLDTLATEVGDGDVQAGPELNAYAALLTWPIVAVALVLVVGLLSAPEPRSAPSSPP